MWDEQIYRAGGSGQRLGRDAYSGGKGRNPDPPPEK